MLLLLPETLCVGGALAAKATEEGSTQVVARQALLLLLFPSFTPSRKRVREREEKDQLVKNRVKSVEKAANPKVRFESKNGLKWNYSTLSGSAESECFHRQQNKNRASFRFSDRVSKKRSVSSFVRKKYLAPELTLASRCSTTSSRSRPRSRRKWSRRSSGQHPMARNLGRWFGQVFRIHFRQHLLFRCRNNLRILIRLKSEDLEPRLRPRSLRYRRGKKNDFKIFRWMVVQHGPVG